MNMNKIMKKKFDDLYIGKRVELISTTDIWTDLRAGAQGTVDLIDDAGTIRYDPSGYGMLIKDIIVDSVMAYLGLASTRPARQ